MCFDTDRHDILEYSSPTGALKNQPSPLSEIYMVKIRCIWYLI
jgi:hypothetical protein